MSNTRPVTDILTRLHDEIRKVEVHYKLLYGKGDFRARIEFFHDAVRAHLAGNAPERLTLERLAYDVEALRYLQAHPLAALHPPEEARPTGKLKLRETLPASAAPKPDRAAKQRLGELYQQYGVVFAALLKPEAESDFQARQEALDTRAGELLDAMDAAKNGAGSRALMDSVAHLEDTELRAKVTALIQAGKLKEAVALMKDAKIRTDAESNDLNNTHHRYAMAQLALFEQGKEVVKKLAGAGLNLAGRFVESAMAQAARETGRGR